MASTYIQSPNGTITKIEYAINGKDSWTSRTLPCTISSITSELRIKVVDVVNIAYDDTQYQIKQTANSTYSSAYSNDSPWSW